MESSNFRELFSGLTPLTDDVESKGYRGVTRFNILSVGKEPYIETVIDNPSNCILSQRERKLYDEIIRIEDAFDVFGVGVQTGVKPHASLWGHPHLINMMEGVNSVFSNGEPLGYDDSEVFLILKVSVSADAAEAGVNLALRTDEGDKYNIIFLDDTRVWVDNKVCTVRSVGDNYRGVLNLISPVDRSILDNYLSLFLTYVGNVHVEINGLPVRRSASAEKAIPTLFFEKVAADKALYLRTGVSFDSLSSPLQPGFRPTFIVRFDGESAAAIHPVEGCDIEGKTAELASMINASAPNRGARKEVFREDDFFIIPEETAGPFLLKCLPQVLETFRLVGSDKLREYKVVASQPRMNFKFSSGIDFLEGEGDITIGDESFSIGDFLHQYAKKKYIQLSDGNRGVIDDTYIRKLQRIFRRRDKNGKIKVTLFDLPEVEELMESKITGRFAAKSRSTLEGFNDLKEAGTPKYKVKATLRPYQNEGVKWMKYLYDTKLGGCLADDMGLGKTLQTIALFTLIYPKSKRPSLVIMPRSLLFNWEKELSRFAPKLKHHTYYGADRSLEQALEAQIILTTYGTVRNDILKIKEHGFECVVLDESQNIKNVSAQTTMAVQLLESDHRFALSGTPIENNLTELYSLFRFLNPTMFGSLDDFNASYTVPVQKYGDKDASKSLRQKIFPFILRRLKKDVLDDLPPRIDQVRYVEMSERQKRLYNERRQSYKQQISEAIARDGIHKSQFMMLQALTELRRIASVPDSMTPGKMESPKVDELLESLSEAVSNGHKAVVFFNFLAGLEIVSDKLEKLGIGYESMTGSTSANARKQIVDRFQNDPDCMVMLMTLKVGGVGLNLTAADTVYIFEPWWNKAAEEQAINRLHRIGQKSTVNSFSLITVDSIEEKILQLQEQKSLLFNELISADGSSSKSLTEEDINFILS